MAIFDHTHEEWVASRVTRRDDDGRVAGRQTEWFATREEAERFEREGE